MRRRGCKSRLGRPRQVSRPPMLSQYNESGNSDDWGDWVTELPPIAKQPPRARATQIAEDPWAEPVYISEPRPSASFSRRLFGRISVQFCSM
jgi:hypothetical protein